jgi:hypothetical protein
MSQKRLIDYRKKSAYPVLLQGEQLARQAHA